MYNHQPVSLFCTYNSNWEHICPLPQKKKKNSPISRNVFSLEVFGAIFIFSLAIQFRHNTVPLWLCKHSFSSQKIWNWIKRKNLLNHFLPGLARTEEVSNQQGVVVLDTAQLYHIIEIIGTSNILNFRTWLIWVVKKHLGKFWPICL